MRGEFTPDAFFNIRLSDIEDINTNSQRERDPDAAEALANVREILGARACVWLDDQEDLDDEAIEAARQAALEDTPETTHEIYSNAEQAATAGIKKIKATRAYAFASAPGCIMGEKAPQEKDLLADVDELVELRGDFRETAAFYAPEEEEAAA